MLLAIDVGNTNTVFGSYDEEEPVMNFRIGTDTNRTCDEYGVLIKELFDIENRRLSEIQDVIISSVVPDTMHAIESFAVKYCKCKPMIVGQGLETGLALRYSDPKELGTDRIVNAVGALNKYKGPLIIIDFGTATTFCVINEKNEYLGGVIAPGAKISAEALFEKTSKLPKIELVKPAKYIGASTVTAMQSGVVNGYIGVVKHILHGIMEELETDKKITVIATGGLAGMICENIEEVDAIERNLTLECLLLIYKRNKMKEKI